MKMLEPGQEIQSKIVAISDDCIFLELNAKSEGILDRSELTDENGNLTVKEGDIVSAFFLKSENGEMYFTTKIGSRKADSSMLENAFHSHIPVEGHVEKEIKGGFEIKIGDVRAFCPYSQMGYRQKEEPQNYIGKIIPFIITEYRENGKNLLVSNRRYLEEEHLKKIDSLRSVIKEGIIMTGTVKSLQSFGAFIDINGLQALLPISEVSLSHINDISTVLSIGQEIQVVILKTDWEHERISVSMKALIKDPWEQAGNKYRPDTKWEGSVCRIAEFGIFVNLEPGIDGLVHISELENAGKTTNLRKLYKTGDAITVLVKEIDSKNKRIALTPAISTEQDIYTGEFLEHQHENDGETYNPFASLLKKKK